MTDPFNDVPNTTAPSADPNVNYVTSDVVKLSMGDDIGLTKKDPTLRHIRVAAGWEIRSLEGEPPDLDLNCFILNREGETRQDQDFVFYNNPASEKDEVRYLGDSRTGAGEGDDEAFSIDLNELDFDADTLMFVVSIHEGDINEQDFTNVKDLFIRIINEETDTELCRLDIPDEFLDTMKKISAICMGKVFRDGVKWRFHAIGEAVEKGGLREVATGYGLIIL